MKSILYLAHRIPYPPNKGDKIRSFHVLQHLARHYQVFLGAFVDDPDDWQYCDALSAYCAGTKFINLQPESAKWRSLQGLIRGEALTLPYYGNAEMRRWVARCLQTEQIDSALVFSSSMAQYLMTPFAEHVRKVIDFVDIDSDKWRQYSEKKTWPLNWVYAREARYLAHAEKQYAQHFSASVFVSEAEAALFCQQTGIAIDRVHAINNGVDTTYFTPNPQLPVPLAGHETRIVFTGAMDYWANVDAVVWFVEEVFGIVRAQYPNTRFVIVGSNPTAEVQRLALYPGVTVTGRVADVRPYLQHASLAIAPLRIARGIQNKVLEAMAMARPVICSNQAAAGISDFPLPEKLCAETPIDFAARVIDCLSMDAQDLYALGMECRQFVLQHYSWERSLDKFTALLAVEQDNLQFAYG